MSATSSDVKELIHKALHEKNVEAAENLLELSSDEKIRQEILQGLLIHPHDPNQNPLMNALKTQNHQVAAILLKIPDLNISNIKEKSYTLLVNGTKVRADMLT